MFFKKTYRKYLDDTIKYSKTTLNFITTFGFVSGTVSDIIINDSFTVYVLNNATVKLLNNPDKEMKYSYLEFSSSEIRAICSLLLALRIKLITSIYLFSFLDGLKKCFLLSFFFMTPPNKSYFA